MLNLALVLFLCAELAPFAGTCDYSNATIEINKLILIADLCYRILRACLGESTLKTKHWLIGGVAILVAFGGSFAHRFRVENDGNVYKQAGASVASDTFSRELFDCVL